MSENKWPAWVWLDDSTSYDYDARCEWGVWNEPVSDLVEPVTEVYIRRDAARAWQALRDLLDGTTEQWREMVRRHERMALGL